MPPSHTWPGSRLALGEYASRRWASGSTVQGCSLLNLLVEARLKGDPGNLSQALRPRLPCRWMQEVPGVWAVGGLSAFCTTQLWTGQ